MVSRLGVSRGNHYRHPVMQSSGLLRIMWRGMPPTATSISPNGTEVARVRAPQVAVASSRSLNSLEDLRGDHQVFPWHSGALEHARSTVIDIGSSRDEITHRDESTCVTTPFRYRDDDVAGFAQCHGGILDDHLCPGDQHAVEFARVWLVRSDGNDA